MTPTPTKWLPTTKVAHNGMLMKLFSSFFLAYWEINTKYQMAFLSYICSIMEWNPSLASSLWFPSQRSVALKLLSVLVCFQGLPTTTVSQRYGLRCPLRTTTTPYPTSLPTAWTETPWEGDATPFTPQLRALETGPPPRSRSSCKTAGFSTVTSRWRPGKSKCVPFTTILSMFFFQLTCLPDANI